VAICIDASCLINFSNVGSLEFLASLPDANLLVSPMVAGECHADCISEIVRLSSYFYITFIESSQIDAGRYLYLLETYNLGEGETECLAICSYRPSIFCCDDRKARNVATSLFGAERVIGSAGLLRCGVETGRTTTSESYNIYLKMKARGGFLPDLQRSWFELWT